MMDSQKTSSLHLFNHFNEKQKTVKRKVLDSISEGDTYSKFMSYSQNTKKDGIQPVVSYYRNPNKNLNGASKFYHFFKVINNSLAPESYMHVEKGKIELGHKMELDEDNDEKDFSVSLSALISEDLEGIEDEDPSSDLPNKKQELLQKDIIKTYKELLGIKEFFEWQETLLQNSKMKTHNSSLIYSAPTSAGKSLVSEILMLKNALMHKDKLVIVIFPYISLINEKEKKYKKLFEHYGLNSISVHSGKFLKYVKGETNILMCTIEKANSFINKLVRENGIEELFNAISCIVIDEFHLIGCKMKGYFIESIITKILYAKEVTKTEDNIQIIGLSATLPNLDEIAEWMKSELYWTTFRPVMVHEYVKIVTNIVPIQDFVHDKLKECGIRMDKFTKYSFEMWNEPEDKFKILPLILQTVTNSATQDAKIKEQRLRKSGKTGSVLVFCQSKNICEKTWESLFKLTANKHKLNINEDTKKSLQGMNTISLQLLILII